MTDRAVPGSQRKTDKMKPANELVAALTVLLHDRPCQSLLLSCTFTAWFAYGVSVGSSLLADAVGASLGAAVAVTHIHLQKIVVNESGHNDHLSVCRYAHGAGGTQQVSYAMSEAHFTIKTILCQVCG